MKAERPVTEIHDPERVILVERPSLVHLGAHRGLIVRRTLLASALRGFLPLPIVDDLLARRILAGLFQKLAQGRVDLPPESASALAEDSENARHKLTFAAIAAVVARFAGRKFLALLAAGRSAGDMARIFLRATLFDHYCAQLHVGGPLVPDEAARLLATLEGVEREASLDPILAAFGEGSRMLGRTLLEAPRWVSQRMASLAERFVHSGGNPDILDSIPELPNGDSAWLDRAARTVEEALGRASAEPLASVVADFEARWRKQR